MNMKQWAILEPMGHGAKVAGRYFKDGEMYRIEVLGPDGEFVGTQIYGPKAIYRISLVDEEMANLAAKNFDTSPPIVYELKAELRRLQQLALPGEVAEEPPDYYDDNDDGSDDVPF